MPKLIVENVSGGSVPIADLGLTLQAGDTVTYEDQSDLEKAQESASLADAAEGGLITLSDDVMTASPADARAFLRTIQWLRSGPFSIPLRDENGEETVALPAIPNPGAVLYSDDGVTWTGVNPLYTDQGDQIITDSCLLVYEV